MTRTRSFAAALLVLALPAVAEAQLCKPMESVTKCVDRLLEDSNTAEGAAKTAAAAAAKNTETGVFDPANGLSSSVKDFRPLLQLSGLLGPMQNDEKSGVISVAINPFLTGKNKQTQVRVQVNTQGKLYGPLKSALTKEVAEALEKKLTTEKDRQNVTVEFSYNHTNNRFGRGYAQQDDLLGNLLAAILQRPTVMAANGRVAKAAIALAKAVIDAGMDPDVHPMGMFEAKRTIIEPLIIDRVEASRTADAVIASVIKSTGLNRFGTLVLNRPQLHFAGSLSSRDPMYGPNDRRLRGTFERGVGQGFNAFLKEVQSLDCEKEGESCLAKFQKIATANDLNAQVKAGARYSAFAEVHEFDEYKAPTEVADLTHGKVTTMVLGGTLGRLVGVDDKGVTQGRLDVAVKWEHVLKGSTATDQKTASITFTKKIGDVSVPLGLVWANRPEFLEPGSYDHGLTARVGLKFNLFPAVR